MTDGFLTRDGAEWDVSSEVDDTAELWHAPSPARSSDGFARGFRPSRDIAILSRPTGLQAESIGSLRSHLRANHLRDGRRSLAVCSATPRVGTSFVAANLAVSLAMSGASTLLIDGNLREPSQQDFIIPDRLPAGLREYLSDDRMAPDDIIQDNVMPNLGVVYSSPAGSEAQSLLSRRKLDALFDAAMRDYDITIVDTPPAARYGDARRISAALHHAMIVVRKSHSFLDDIKTLSEELASDRVRIVGSFLNDYSEGGV